MYNISEAELVAPWVSRACDYADDESALFGLRYIGSEASGVITIAATGDMTFEHGASGSEVADTDTKIDAGGLGVIDMSADVTTYFDLLARINTSDNWEAWPLGCIPDAHPHTTTVAHFLAVTDGDCNGANGYTVLADTTDGAGTSGALYSNFGLTFLGPSTKMHGSDAQVVHQIHRISALSTFTSGTSALRIIECDDDAGTSEIVMTPTAGATTVAVWYPAETAVLTNKPYYQCVGKRLVVSLLNSAVMNTTRLTVEGRSAIIGPSVRPSKMLSRLC